MSQLVNDLTALLNALSAFSSALLANGDIDGNGRVLGAMSAVSAALSQAGAEDIIANLPSDADGKKIQAMLAQMNTEAAKIAANQKSVTQAVGIATGIANIVADCFAGQIGPAVIAANGIIPFL